MQEIIDQCRVRFGPAPRSFSLGERMALTTRPPAWMYKHRKDDLWEIYQRRDDLLQNGTVVWGCLVQANEILFAPGETDAPAMAIYSPDRYYDNHVDELADLASHLFRLKGTQPTIPALAEFARIITDEMTRPMRFPIPAMLAGGHDVFATSIMVQRAHLPHGFLTGGIFPLVIAPGRARATMILPSRYWPRVLQYAFAEE